MTPTELASLEALAKAATPGKWRSQGVSLTRDADYGCAFVVAEYGGLVAAALPYPTELDDDNFPRVEANAAYIAAANPAALLSLIEENKRMREALGEVVGADDYLAGTGFRDAFPEAIQKARAALEPQS